MRVEGGTNGLPAKLQVNAKLRPFPLVKGNGRLKHGLNFGLANYSFALKVTPKISGSPMAPRTGAEGETGVMPV